MGKKMKKVTESKTEKTRNRNPEQKREKVTEPLTKKISETGIRNKNRKR